MTPAAARGIAAGAEAKPPADPHRSLLQRLRVAGLRPTAARIGIFQVLDAARPHGVSADGVFQLLLRRGTRASASTVYRVVREFEEHGLVSNVWDESKKAVYVINAAEPDPARLFIGCARTGQLVAISDADLHSQLVAAARRYGLDIEGRELFVRA